jgi:hypothetical protein
MKYKFKCVDCGCEQMNAVYRGVDVYARITDFTETADGSMEFRILDRMLSIKTPSEYICEACRALYARSRKELFEEAHTADAPGLTPVKDDPERRYRRAAELLRRTVMDYFVDAVDRGAEQEMAALDKVLQTASEAGIHEVNVQNIPRDSTELVRVDVSKHGVVETNTGGFPCEHFYRDAKTGRVRTDNSNIKEIEDES